MSPSAIAHILIASGIVLILESRAMVLQIHIRNNKNGVLLASTVTFQVWFWQGAVGAEERDKPCLKALAKRKELVQCVCRLPVENGRIQPTSSGTSSMGRVRN